MKIRFRKDTHIRSDHRSLEKDPLGKVYKNAEIQVDGILHEGATIRGNNHWWRDLNGWYYWSGETKALEPMPEPVQAPEETLDLPVVLAPHDPIIQVGEIPDGEWRLVRDGISISPESHLGQS